MRRSGRCLDGHESLDQGGYPGSGAREDVEGGDTSPNRSRRGGEGRSRYSYTPRALASEKVEDGRSLTGSGTTFRSGAEPHAYVRGYAVCRHLRQHIGCQYVNPVLTIPTVGRDVSAELFTLPCPATACMMWWISYPAVPC